MIDAVIRFVVMFVGASTPYTSCVIFPMAPIGVMSVSPVALAATIESRKVTSTATIPIHQLMPKNWCPSSTQARPESPQPITHQEAGTSMCRRGSAAAGSPAPPTNCESPPKARSTVRQRRANDTSPAVTIIAVAGQRTQPTMPR